MFFVDHLTVDYKYMIRLSDFASVITVKQCKHFIIVLLY